MEGMPDRSRKRRPGDLNALAASIVGDATDEPQEGYTFRVEWSAQDKKWAGRCAEFPSLVGLDPDKSEALSGIQRLVREVADSDTHTPAEPADGKDPAAVALGRKGGLKGGKARAAKLTPEQRSEIAKKAAQSRWHRSDNASNG
jgi:hypothetical protein